MHDSVVQLRQMIKGLTCYKCQFARRSAFLGL